jgi:hypothetical protein
MSMMAKTAMFEAVAALVQMVLENDVKLSPPM